MTILGFSPILWYGRQLLRNIARGVDLWRGDVIRAHAFNSCKLCTVYPGVSPYPMGARIVKATARLSRRNVNRPHSMPVARWAPVVLVGFSQRKGERFPVRCSPSFSLKMRLSNRQAALVPLYCLGVLGAALVPLYCLGAQNQRLLAECKPAHGAAYCELKILGRWWWNFPSLQTLLIQARRLLIVKMGKLSTFTLTRCNLRITNCRQF